MKNKIIILFLLIISLSGCKFETLISWKTEEKVNIQKNTTEILNVLGTIELTKEERKIKEKITKSDDLVKTFSNYFSNSKFSVDSYPVDGNNVEILEWISLCQQWIWKWAKNFIMEVSLDIVDDKINILKKEFLSWNNDLCKNELYKKIWFNIDCENTFYKNTVNKFIDYYYWLIEEKDFIKRLEYIINIEKEEIKKEEYSIKLTEWIYLAELIKKLIINDEKIFNEEFCYKLYYDLTK